MGDPYLPPGVSVSMIPGNRPEDLAEEAFWEAWCEKMLEKDYRQPDLDDFQENDFSVAAVTVGRDLGYTQGMNEGRDDERMAQAYKEEEAWEKRSCDKCGEPLGDEPRAEVVLRDKSYACHFIVHAESCYNEQEHETA